MSYSKICIASDIPACKEALGENGIYVASENADDLAEKMQDVCNNYNKIAPFGKLNYERILKQFTWGDIAIQYEKYCEKIVLKKTHHEKIRS